jgi:hypothetical protein
MYVNIIIIIIVNHSNTKILVKNDEEIDVLRY